MLQSQFGVGLREAAQNLRICPTTLKRACRRHGITRWPRRQTWTSEGVQLCEAPSEPLTLDMEPASPVTAPKGQPGLQAMQVQLGMSPAPSMPVLSRQATGNTEAALVAKAPGAAVVVPVFSNPFTHPMVTAPRAARVVPEFSRPLTDPVTADGVPAATGNAASVCRVWLYYMSSEPFSQDVGP